MYPTALRSILPLAAVLLLSAACGSTVTPPPETQPAPASEPEPPPEPPAPEPEPEEPAPEPEGTACAGGAIKDDGSVETGYGYVPSAKMGVYVQEIDSSELPSRELSEVCVCWLRTRADDNIDFEVVFYPDQGGRPSRVPYAKVRSTANEVPKGVDAAGRFYSVDVSDVTLAEGTSYVGVHWNPSASTFFFVCTDTSEETPYTNVFSAEDRAPAWTNIKDSRDPIFRPHRSILVRVKSAE